MSSNFNIARIQSAIDAYVEGDVTRYSSEPPRTILTDFLADLRHWVDANLLALQEDPFDANVDGAESGEIVWEEVLATAIDLHYAEEVAEAS